jgi:hypothetical protein
MEFIKLKLEAGGETYINVDKIKEVRNNEGGAIVIYEIGNGNPTGYTRVKEHAAEIMEKL